MGVRKWAYQWPAAAQAGHVISAYALGVVVGAPVLAVCLARLPRRNVLVGLMLAFAAANGLSGFAPSYHWMLAFRFAAGLPMADFIGQIVGWRWAFALVALLALATSLMVLRAVPLMRVTLHDAASPLAELSALRRPQVWLALGMGAIGFGGMFAVYTYLASTLLLVTKTSATMVPVMLGIFGIGLTAGNLISAWFADKALMPTVAVVLIWTLAALALYPFMTHAVWSMALAVLLIGGGGGLATPLQARLMQVAEGAQTLAAALNHSAFNFANALGPWLAGMAIAAGYGWGSSGWVGCGLALAGLVLWVVAVLGDRRAQAALSAPAPAQ